MNLVLVRAPLITVEFAEKAVGVKYEKLQRLKLDIRLLIIK